MNGNADVYGFKENFLNLFSLKRRLREKPFQIIPPFISHPVMIQLLSDSCSIRQLTRLVVCILEAVFTVSPKKQYLGTLIPTTPATAGPEWIPKKVEHACTRLCSFSLDTSGDITGGHSPRRKYINTLAKCRFKEPSKVSMSKRHPSQIVLLFANQCSSPGPPFCEVSGEEQFLENNDNKISHGGSFNHAYLSRLFILAFSSPNF